MTVIVCLWILWLFWLDSTVKGKTLGKRVLQQIIYPLHDRHPTLMQLIDHLKCNPSADMFKETSECTMFRITKICITLRQRLCKTDTINNNVIEVEHFLTYYEFIFEK